MKKKRYFRVFLWMVLLFAAGGMFRVMTYRVSEVTHASVGMGNWFHTVWETFSDEPEEVRTLREQELVLSEEGHQEYYFKLLNEEEQRGYREMLNGIRSRQEEFYLTISGDGEVDRVYHALLKDHPELYWVHNRKQVYKTAYEGSDYCLFSPGYSYTEEEILLGPVLMQKNEDDYIAYCQKQYEKYKTILERSSGRSDASIQKKFLIFKEFLKQ